MAQNISISEGGTAQQFGQINKLKIANSGGGTSLWVPEDEVQTKSLHVDSNGTYYASQDECYGYDEVSVNITDECFGYDDDGNLWDVEVDEDDFLEEEGLPVRIEVTTPPTKTSYIAYEPINTAGMVVTAYYGDDTEYGEIPREEYTIDPIVAVATTSKGGKATSSLQTNIAQPISFLLAGVSVIIYHPSQTNKYSETYFDEPAILYSTNTDYKRVFAAIASTKNTNTLHVRSARTLEELKNASWLVYTNSMQSEFTINDKTVYIGENQIMSRNGDDVYDTSGVTVYNTTPDNNSEWTIVYGDISIGSEVTVKWIRPQDEEELTDKFEITVTDPPIPPVSGDDSGGGGSSGGSW